MNVTDILKIASVGSVVSDMMSPEYIYSEVDFETDQ
jgi:hypothetical protein